MDAAFIERVKRNVEYQRERKGPPEGFPSFPPVSGGRYTDPNFLALEDARMWKRSWLYACHTDEIPGGGQLCSVEEDRVTDSHRARQR